MFTIQQTYSECLLLSATMIETKRKSQSSSKAKARNEAQWWAHSPTT